MSSVMSSSSAGATPGSSSVPSADGFPGMNKPHLCIGQPALTPFTSLIRAPGFIDVFSRPNPVNPVLCQESHSLKHACMVVVRYGCWPETPNQSRHRPIPLPLRRGLEHVDKVTLVTYGRFRLAKARSAWRMSRGNFLKDVFPPPFAVLPFYIAVEHYIACGQERKLPFLGSLIVELRFLPADQPTLPRFRPAFFQAAQKKLAGQKVFPFSQGQYTDRKVHDPGVV